MQLVEGALNEMRPGRLELVALIGPSGCGKTLLAEHLVACMGGYVVDVGQASLIDIMRLGFTDGDRILLFDQSSEPAPEFWEYRVYGGSRREPPQLTTLSALGKARRVRHTTLPLDSFHDLSMMGTTTLRHRLAENPGLVVVATFANEDEAVQAIRSTARIVNGDPAVTFQQNWQRVHVVSLEDMGRRTIDLSQAPAISSLSD